MIHNGIEYGDMQLICEAYFLLKHALGLGNDELYDVFDAWNGTELESYLIEITRDIFSVKDGTSGDSLVDKVLDTAQQKGTGKWMSQHALDLGVPTTLVTEAVFARCLSAQKEARVRASKVLAGPQGSFRGDKQAFIEDVRQALYVFRRSQAMPRALCSWTRPRRSWAGNSTTGRSPFCGGAAASSVPASWKTSRTAFEKTPGPENLLLDDFFRKATTAAQPSWRRVVTTAVELGLPVPGFSAALSYYDAYRRDRLPANLLQAQRDYFGAHTYQRVDKPGTFHTDWLHAEAAGRVKGRGAKKTDEILRRKKSKNRQADTCRSPAGTLSTAGCAGPVTLVDRQEAVVHLQDREVDRRRVDGAVRAPPSMPPTPIV